MGMMPFPGGSALTITRACGGTAGCVGSAMAIKAGRMTRNGKSIFGNAPISGVRLAALMDLAAMAGCTTRKSVHQEPKDNTKPKPITSPNDSTPRLLALAWLSPPHDGAELVRRAAFKPDPPSTYRSPRY